MTLLFIWISLAGAWIYRLINWLAAIFPDALMLLKFRSVAVVIDACLLLKSDKLAFASKAVCVALEIGLFASVVLSTLPSQNH